MFKRAEVGCSLEEFFVHYILCPLSCQPWCSISLLSYSDIHTKKTNQPHDITTVFSVASLKMTVMTERCLILDEKLKIESDLTH